jgi:hypothetical protein
MDGKIKHEELYEELHEELGRDDMRDGTDRRTRVD